MSEHTIVKPEVIADAAAVAFKDQVVVSNTITKESFDAFTGKANDTITVRVPGTLPVREYGWRNDRSKPIVTDEYHEQTVDIKVEPTMLYSATPITDEQKAFDFKGDFGRLFNAQTSVLAEKNERNVLNQIVSAPYEYRKSIDNSSANIEAMIRLNRDPLHMAFVKAKGALKKMLVPGGGNGYIALAGSNAAEELMINQRLVAAQTQGLSALDEASIGRLAGITIVEDSTIGADDIYIYDRSAFVWYNAAPPVPNSSPFAAAANIGGVSLRWILDYDSAYSNDRSLYSTWVGYGHTLDTIELWNGENQSIKSTEQFFTRGVHLRLGKDSTFDKAPGDGGVNGETPGSDEDSFLAKAFNGKFAVAPIGEGGNFEGTLTTALAADTVPAG